MANKDYGRGQQYDEDTANDQWAQQGGQQQHDADPGSQGNMPDPWSQQGGMGGYNPNMPPGDMDDQDWQNQQGGMGNQDQWSQQQGGLSEDPLSQDSPFGEGGQQDQGMSRRDRAEGGDIDSAFGNP